MKYINRHIGQIINQAEKTFSAILVTGARQVGKTTLLKHIKNEIRYVTLDDPLLLQTVIDDPGTFFKSAIPPVIVDEVQYAPQLFPYIKMIADNENKKGQFFLTGSQQFHMMKNVSESLAGRIAIINLLGLSLREINNITFDKPFIPIKEYFSEREKSLKHNSYKHLWEIIHKGSMPVMYSFDMDWNMFYSSYTKTYIERDVKGLTQVGDEQKFIRFMISLAARTSQMLNLSSVANEVGISNPTANRWLSILVTSNIVFLLQPYYNNLTKRMVKTPKIYFLDTGLAAYLTKWTNSEVLESGVMAGAFFESFVISEILKSYYNIGILRPPLYYYRDKDMKEIDLLIERDNTLYPIEIKKTSTPRKEHIKNFSVLNKLHNKTIGTGGLICLYDDLLDIDQNNIVIPVNYL
ncbi:MAG: ATP-binding protein [Clostridiales bacterium]|nr:ATP-binding protein [Clostridiales bacterium]